MLLCVQNLPRSQTTAAAGHLCRLGLTSALYQTQHRKTSNPCTEQQGVVTSTAESSSATCLLAGPDVKALMHVNLLVFPAGRITDLHSLLTQCQQTTNSSKPTLLNNVARSKGSLSLHLQGNANITAGPPRGTSSHLHRYLLCSSPRIVHNVVKLCQLQPCVLSGYSLGFFIHGWLLIRDDI